MYQKTDKRRLYWLIAEYLDNKISAKEFSSEFYDCFDHELDKDELTKYEYLHLKLLDQVAVGYSDLEEEEGESVKYPGLYFNEVQLRAKVLETVEALKDVNPLTEAEPE